MLRASCNFGVKCGVGLYLHFEEIQGQSVLLSWNVFLIKLLFEGGIQAFSVYKQFSQVGRRFKARVSGTIPFTAAKDEKIGGLLQVGYVDWMHFLVIYVSRMTIFYGLIKSEVAKSMTGVPACEQ